MTSPSCVLHPGHYAGSTCPRCGNFTCVTCNPDGRTECPTCKALSSNAVRGKVPWERRDELGLVKAFWLQVKETTFEPRRFWATVDRAGSAADPFWFAWLVSVVAAIGSAPYQALNFWLQAKQFEDIGRQLGNSGPMTQVLELFVWLGNHPVQATFAITAYTVIIFPLGYFVNVGLVHVGCLIAGMRNHPISVTARALGYAQAPNLALVIPVVGSFAAFYTFVLQIWGVRELQQGTTVRAVIACLWFTVLFMCLGLVAGVAVATMLVSKLH